jgi:5-methylcytosine-specific restriction endonuclease McrA
VRIRTIKPEFFTHEGLFAAERETGLPIRVAFSGLWCYADREGRFKWEPRRLKLAILPYDEIDFALVMETLSARQFVLKYELGGAFFGAIINFTKHQAVNQREAQSVLPAPGDKDVHVHARASTCIALHATEPVNIPSDIRETVFARDGHKCVRCAASENLTIDHIFPQSIGGTHAPPNLRTLCGACNSARPVAGKALLDDLAKDGLTMGDMLNTCMHVRARGEGKGRERKGKDSSEPGGSEAQEEFLSEERPNSDPRHHEISSRWGPLFEGAFGAKYSFTGRDAAALKRFLGTVKDPSEEIMTVAARAWDRAKQDRFAKRCKEAATVHGLCAFYNEIRVELQTPGADANHRTGSGRGFGQQQSYAGVADK